jgi:hypothetical protein
LVAASRSSAGADAAAVDESAALLEADEDVVGADDAAALELDVLSAAFGFELPLHAVIDSAAKAMTEPALRPVRRHN